MLDELTEALDTLPDAGVAVLARAVDRALGRNRLAEYVPYPKQRVFHDAGREHRERLLMAANQVGKTLAGGMEWAMHLTGRYPEWWRGRCFERPVRLWAAGVTGETTRDVVQGTLLGPPAVRGAMGTGTIPADAIIETAAGRGIADAVDTALIRHASGGQSLLQFKSYERGREKWQGVDREGVWFDEEPPLDVYLEGITRTNITAGIVIVTFTPLLGLSAVVALFPTWEQAA